MLAVPMNRRSRSSVGEKYARPYCLCCIKDKIPASWTPISKCVCGENYERNVSEWKWEVPPLHESSSWVCLSADQKQVTFHPFYSSGTVAVRGDTPLLLNQHYYWEVKILSETYGTDIMVGVGTSKVNTSHYEYSFISLLGQDEESYGLSYTGKVRHSGLVSQESAGFCRGSIVGVRLDLWHGTLEFYINRKPQGVSFYNLRRHSALYPIVCSTVARSGMRLVYTASWRASLLVDAARALSPSLGSDRLVRVPPGLWFVFRSQFWLTLPTGGGQDDDDDDDGVESKTLTTEKVRTSEPWSPGLQRRYWTMRARVSRQRLF